MTEAIFQRYDALGYRSSIYYATRHSESSPQDLNSPSNNVLENLRDAASAVEDHFNVVVKIKTSWMLKGIPMETRLKHEAWNTEKSLSLESLLFKTWVFECSDPRDKIYSLLGIAVSRSDFLGIVPDYNRTVEEVYAQVTRYIIDNWQNLGVLGNIPDSFSNKLPNLPSWVIDFSTTGIAGISGSHFNAASTIAQQPRLAPAANWRQLKVEGIRLSGVVEAGNVLLEGNNPQLHFDPAWYILVSHLDQSYPTGESRCDVLWRTLCLDQDVFERYPAPPEYRDQFREVVCAMICMEGEKSMAEKAAGVELSRTLLRPLLQLQMPSEDAEKAAQFMVAGSAVEDTPEPGIHGPYYDHIRNSLHVLEEIAETDLSSAFPTLDQIEEFRQNSDWHLLGERGGAQIPKTALFSNKENNFLRASSRFHKRRLFRTEKNFLGLGPESLLTGDEVWILAGTGRRNLPFILRPQVTGTYRLVGVTYVHGVMHGEAITSDVNLEEITLE